MEVLRAPQVKALRRPLPDTDPKGNRYGTGVPEGTYMRRYEAPLRSRIDPEANCACPDAR
jgi:hypothetical protein